MKYKITNCFIDLTKDILIYKNFLIDDISKEANRNKVIIKYKKEDKPKLDQSNEFEFHKSILSRKIQ